MAEVTTRQRLIEQFNNRIYSRTDVAGYLTAIADRTGVPVDDGAGYLLWNETPYPFIQGAELHDFITENF